MKKLFEHWRGFIDEAGTNPSVEDLGEGESEGEGEGEGEGERKKYPWLTVDASGNEIFTPGRFLAVKKEWIKEYTDGVNKEVWINYLQGKLRVRRGTRANRGVPEKFVHLHYRKNVLPLVYKAIMGTKIYPCTGGPGCMEYVSVARFTQGGTEKHPGIYIDRSTGDQEALSIVSHELSHAIDDYLGSHGFGAGAGRVRKKAEERAKERKRVGVYRRPGEWRWRGRDERSEAPTARGFGRGEGETLPDVRFKERPSLGGAPSMSERQWHELKKVFPDMDDKAAIAAAKKAGQDTHSYLSWEIYANIIDLRRRTKRLLTANDIARLRSTTSWPQPLDSVYAEMDLAEALQRLANQGMSDHEIATRLNRVAQAGAGHDRNLRRMRGRPGYISREKV